MTSPEASRTVEREVRVLNTLGLHFRPATRLVKLATQFESEITLTRGDRVLSAKSIMEILLLAAEQGTAITLKATGPDAEKAIDAIASLFARKFEEE